jgi:hypothetical protein
VEPCSKTRQPDRTAPTPGHMLVFLLCLLCLLPLVGCGPNPLPDHRVGVPQVALDPQGNVFALYEVSEGRGAISYLQKVGPDGTRLWGEEGIRLDTRQPDYPGGGNAATAPDSQNLIADEAGNVTAFWTYQGQIYAKKVDTDGDPVWASEHVVVGTFAEPTSERRSTRWFVTTNATGTTVVWRDETRALNARGLDGDGNILWTAEPPSAHVNELTPWRDHADNTWIIWADQSTRAIYLQVIDEQGGVLWEEAERLREGVPPGGSAGPRIFALWLADDGSDGVVAAWQGYSENDDPAKIRNVTLTGEVRMSPADLFFKEHPHAVLPRPLIAGTDGLVVLWAEGDSTLVQRIDLEGDPAWEDGGVVAATKVAPLRTHAYNFRGSRQPGGTVLTWQSYISDYETVCRAQRIDDQGRLLWGSDGVAITPSVGENRWHWQWSTTTADGAAILTGVMTGGARNHSCLQKVGIDGSLPWGPIPLDDWKKYDWDGPRLVTHPAPAEEGASSSILRRLRSTWATSPLGMGA